MTFKGAACPPKIMVEETRAVFWNAILSYYSYYFCSMYAAHSMHIFCMHGIPRLPATEQFPRTQCAPCDVSSSNVWVNWRRGIVIINLYLHTYTCKLQTIAVHLKTISSVGHKLYFNLYCTFPVKSNEVTFISL